MKPARPEDVPIATHQGEMMILGLKVRVYRLDDGRTVIHADDFHALLAKMGITAADDLLKGGFPFGGQSL